MKIQRELNDTKETLQKAIQSTLERGECGRIGISADGGYTFYERRSDITPFHRREARQPCRKVGQPERIKQNVLHTGEEAELVLRRHVDYGNAVAYELDGWAGSICAASGCWVTAAVYSHYREIPRSLRLDLRMTCDAFIAKVSPCKSLCKRARTSEGGLDGYLQRCAAFIST